MTTEKPARCAIYEDRPQECRGYPKIDNYMPEECTYYFVGNERRGECACGVGACCAVPRDGGEPTAKHLPLIAGGEPCKHLVEGDVLEEKTAAITHDMEFSLDHINITVLVDGPDDS